jgi:hypothetical protein
MMTCDRLLMGCVRTSSIERGVSWRGIHIIIEMASCLSSKEPQ